MQCPFIQFLALLFCQDAVTTRQALPGNILGKLELEEGQKGLQVVLDEVSVWNLNDAKAKMERHNVHMFAKEYRKRRTLHALQFLDKVSEKEFFEREAAAKHELELATEAARQEMSPQDWDGWLINFALHVCDLRAALGPVAYAKMDIKQIHAVALLSFQKTRPGETARGAAQACLRLKRILSRKMHSQLSAQDIARFVRAEAKLHTAVRRSSAQDRASDSSISKKLFSAVDSQEELPVVPPPILAQSAKSEFPDAPAEAHHHGSPEQDLAYAYARAFDPPACATFSEIRKVRGLDGITVLLQHAASFLDDEGGPGAAAIKSFGTRSMLKRGKSVDVAGVPMSPSSDAGTPKTGLYMDQGGRTALAFA